MQVHASCAARHGHGVLLIGPPGSGKSDLVLRLLDHGFDLVADDRVDLDEGVARAPAPLAGLLEIRGLGIVRLPYAASAPVALVVRLESSERMPESETLWGHPMVRIDPAQASAPARVTAALRCALGELERLAWTSVVMVTGLSGAGKASILRALEDLGYDAVDNPPLTLVGTLVDRAERPLAIGLDARSQGFDPLETIGTLDRLRRTPGRTTQLIYASADPAVLLRRFTETRRRHPLAPQGRVIDGIEREITLTLPLRDAADLVVDTSGLPLPALRTLIEQRFGLGAGPGPGVPQMTVTLMSFAFPAGLPREADMVFDARFLRNPHYDPILRPLTGMDPAVAAYVEADPDYEAFFTRILSLLELVLPRFVQEGKKYATIAVGCTGGRHRSVRTVERLVPILQRLGDGKQEQAWQVTTVHRELTKPQAVGHGLPAGTATPSSSSVGLAPVGDAFGKV